MPLQFGAPEVPVGYLYQFIPYGGASPEGKKSEHPLGTKVVLDLLAVVLNPSQCRVFFDNFFFQIIICFAC